MTVEPVPTLPVDVAVIGAGPAGLAAATAAREAGAGRVLVLDRDRVPGGILPQCIHAGFGLHVFSQELTGPEYAERWVQRARDAGVTFLLDTMVLSLDPALSPSDRHGLLAVGPARGIVRVEAWSVVLAMGCRERTRGAIRIPGDRPAGIYTAGTAQRLMNMEGFLPGREVVILGSGDIGLIMARRLTLEGARVSMVLELMPWSGGLLRNRVQCLDDYGIPLLLSTTVTAIHGRGRIRGVTIARVGEDLVPIPGTEQEVPCDTLLLSVGLIPENELSREAGIRLDPRTGGPLVDETRETSVPGVFACGNVLHVHDLVDHVSEEAALAGRHAGRLAGPGAKHGAGSRVASGEGSGADSGSDGGESRDVSGTVDIRPGEGVRAVVPQKLLRIAPDDEPVSLYFRVSRIFGRCRVRLLATAPDGTRLLADSSRSRATPGEMDRLELAGDRLAAARRARDLVLSVEEAAP